MFILIYCILYPISLLPMPLLHLMGDFIYLIVYHIVGYRKEVVRNNLRNSFPDWDEKKMRQTEKRYYHHLCQLLVEGVKMLSMSRRQVMRRYRCTNPEILQPYFDNGQSVILMSAHYNDWEWMVLSLEMQLPHHGIGVGKANTNKSFEHIINKFRTRYGTEVVFADHVRERMKDYFEQGRPCAYMMLSDQTPASANRAYLLPRFLNQPTDMIYGSEYFAKKYHFPVLYYRVKRLRKGFYEWTLEKITDQPDEAPYGSIIETYASKLQRDIENEPACWLWSHKRWKHKEQVKVMLEERRREYEESLTT